MSDLLLLQDYYCYKNVIVIDTAVVIIVSLQYKG